MMLLYDFPFFITLYLLVMSLYHATLYAVMKETKKRIHSKIWDSIVFGNYLGILLTISTSLLLYRFGQIGILHLYILVIIFFDILSHFLILLAVINLTLPILKTLNIIKKEYITVFTGFPVLVILLAGFFIKLPFPKSYIGVLFPYVILALMIIFYSIYLMKIVSEYYSKIGFVYKPFLIGSIGVFSFSISVLIIVFIILNFYNLELLNELYYYIFFYSVLSTITVLQFLRFVIDYPSALQSKWKAYMPFDLFKVALAMTLAFLSISIYFTVKETNNLEIYQNVPYIPLFLCLFIIFCAVALILSYTKIITENSELKYWSYLRAGLFIHLIATFYIFSLTALLWEDKTLKTKIIASMFWLLAFLFYLFYVLDLRTVIKDLGIQIAHDPLDIARYMISLYSIFFLIFLGISFSYNKNILLGSSLESYPVILFFIAVFLVAFTTYLSVTHKGLENLLKKNVWSEFSYMSSFAAFVVVYFLFNSMDVESFPLRGRSEEHTSELQSHSFISYAVFCLKKKKKKREKNASFYPGIWGLPDLSG